MSSVEPRFVVDVTDSSGNVLGDGPLKNVASVEVVEALDQAGNVAVSVPATDSRAVSLLSAENRLHIRTRDGIVARGIIQDFAVIATGAGPMFQASGADLLGELVFYNTGYGCVYDDKNIASEIIGTDATATSLLGSTGWTQGTVSPSIYTTTTITYDAQTILSALITLAQQVGDHLRQGSTPQTLDWGAFGSDSGIRITNAHHVLTNHAYRRDDLAWLGGIQVNNISAEIENVLIPLGKNKFDLRDATNASSDIKVMTNRGPTGAESTVDSAVTAGDTTVTVADATGFEVEQEIWIGDKSDWTQDHEVAVIESVSGNDIDIVGSDGFENSYSTGANVIQNPQFYVEDAASQATYGARGACPTFSWIGPADKSADYEMQQRAADTLYAAANARMTRYSTAYQNYTLGQVYGLPSDLRVGEKVRLVYKGVGKIYGSSSFFVDVDDDFYVLKITRMWTQDGRKVASLEVANVARPMPNNANLVIYNLDTLRWVGMG